MPFSLLAGFETLGKEINKAKGDTSIEREEGFVSPKLPELTLSLSDENIIDLTKKWLSAWDNSEAKSDWEKQSKENERYWLGKHFYKVKADDSRPMVDNAIFESVETYLPQATRRNPEPLVGLASAEESDDLEVMRVKNKYVSKLKTRLAELTDENVLRLKAKQVARHEVLYLIGVLKHGWSIDKDMPMSKVIRPQKLILDPDAVIDEEGYSGDYLGEYRKMSVERLISIVETANAHLKDDEKTGKVDFIKQELKKDERATKVQFIEWWTPEYFVWTIKDHVILKRKNPHWNYDEEKEVEDEPEIDEFGTEIPTTRTESISGINHLPTPRIPYSFLVVYTLGDRPIDNTSLIGQNLANQDILNKRNRQIDKNADNINGGWVISKERSGLNDTQATNFVRAMQKNGAAAIPQGSPQDAIYKFSGQSLPSDVFTDLRDKRERLKDIFGTRGSTPAGVLSEDTVRGKFLNRNLDTDRIGGGITEYLEQTIDETYNWWTQLLYVYDSNFQFIEGGVPPKVKVSVKEGSLLPKDSASIAQQAMELAGMNRISTIDLYKRLEYPNAEELAANVWLEQNAPELLFKDNELVQQALLAAANVTASPDTTPPSAPPEGELNQVVNQ